MLETKMAQKEFMICFGSWKLFGLVLEFEMWCCGSVGWAKHWVRVPKCALIYDSVPNWKYLRWLSHFYDYY